MQCNIYSVYVPVGPGNSITGGGGECRLEPQLDNFYPLSVKANNEWRYNLFPLSPKLVRATYGTHSISNVTANGKVILVLN
jgi:hypothetical protein